MSSIHTIEQHNRSFSTEVTLVDPITDRVFEGLFYIDTGNSDAFALPTDFDETFSSKIGERKRGGVTGGGLLADEYIVRVKQVGDVEMDHLTTCVFSITLDVDYGLMGIDFLNYVITTIYDKPESKLLDLEFEYI